MSDFRSRAASFAADYGAILALLVALTATLGSLYYSEVAGFVPCTFCWYQRILMYPLVLLIFIGIFRHTEALPSFVLPLSLLGVVVSGYHVLLQNGLFGESGTCTIGVPCSIRYVNYLGFITIPLMCLTAFVIVSALMLLLLAGEPAGADTEPRLATSQITGIGLLLVALLALWGVAFTGRPASETTPPETSAATSEGEALFNQTTLGSGPGCMACHSTDAARITVGPSIAAIGQTAAERVPGQTAEAYLRESILQPDAYVVDGYVPGIMYQLYSESLTEAQIDALVDYMLALD